MSSNKLGFKLWFAILKKHFDDFLHIVIQFIQSFALRMSANKAGNIANEKAGLRTLFDNRRVCFHIFYFTTLPAKPPLPALSTIPGQARWNALLQQARLALQTACEEMETYAAARSESWQESERGEEFEERLEALREASAAVEELNAVSEKIRPNP